MKLCATLGRTALAANTFLRTVPKHRTACVLAVQPELFPLQSMGWLAKLGKIVQQVK